MVKIYRLGPDIEKCQWVIPSGSEFAKSGGVIFDGNSRLPNWEPPKFYIQNPIKTRSNCFIVNASAFAFDQKVLENNLVRMHFEMAGEILPIEIENGEKLFILNVTEITNALNQTRTIFRRNPTTKQPTGVIQYEFHHDRMVASSIFKIPETRRAEVLTFADKNCSPEDEFFYAYKESGLTGLKFDQLWASE